MRQLIPGQIEHMQELEVIQKNVGDKYQSLVFLVGLESYCRQTSEVLTKADSIGGIHTIAKVLAMNEPPAVRDQLYDGTAITICTGDHSSSPGWSMVRRPRCGDTPARLSAT